MGIDISRTSSLGNCREVYLALCIIIRHERRLFPIIAHNFISKRNVTNRGTMSHFTLSRIERVESSYRWSTFLRDEDQAFSAFYRVSHKKRMTPASFYRVSLEPTILVVRSREEHLSVTHTHARRAHIRPRARSKSFNAVVLSRLIKFPSILRISPMQLNRNSRLRDRVPGAGSREPAAGSREPTIWEAVEEEKST